MHGNKNHSWFFFETEYNLYFEKRRDWVMESVKNMTGNEKQHAQKLSLRYVEHEDFPVSLAQKEPQTVLDSPHLFSLEERRKGRHTFIMLLLLKDLLNALRCFPYMKSYGRVRYTAGQCMNPVESEAESSTSSEHLCTPGSQSLWGKVRLVLHFFFFD